MTKALIGRPAKLPQLTEKLESLRAELAEVNHGLEGMPEKVHAARVAMIEGNPDTSTSGLNSPATKLQEAERKLLTRQQNLIEEIAAVEQVEAVERAKKAVEDVRPIITEAKEYTATELAAWRKLGEIETERMETISLLIEAVEGRDRLLLSSESLLSICADEALREEAREALTPPILPMPGDSLAVGERVMAATSDPEGRYYGDGAARLDGSGWLLENLPDLRHLLRTAGLSGRYDVVRNANASRDFFSIFPTRV